jgi:sterol desaturase/sphingolipid hydroxylase (fatty acid hydroxylase superfamily)
MSARTLVGRTLLPALLTLSIGAFVIAWHAGWSLQGTVMAASLFALGAGAALERWLPFRSTWNKPQNDIGTDLASAGVVMGLVDPLLKLAAAQAVAWLYGQAVASANPFAALPFLAQVVVAGLIMEFGAYWGHRWHHRQPCLWSLHAMHHGTTRLYSLNNFRVHPLNYTLQFAFSTLPLMLLGVPHEVLLTWLVIAQPVLMLQHVNADLDNRALNHVFSTNELHRWHHASTPAEGDVNFGSSLIVWDKVFGTYRGVRHGEAPQAVGLFAESAAYPHRATYMRQLGVLCSPGCCRG